MPPQRTTSATSTESEESGHDPQHADELNGDESHGRPMMISPEPGVVNRGQGRPTQFVDAIPADETSELSHHDLSVQDEEHPAPESVEGHNHAVQAVEHAETLPEHSEDQDAPMTAEEMERVQTSLAGDNSEKTFGQVDLDEAGDLSEHSDSLPHDSMKP